jgi:L-carnitine CoA-transferase
MRVSPLNCDYVTALFACWSALAAIYKSRQTGHGDSIDIAQYEVMLRISSDYPAKYLNEGKQMERNANTDSMMTGYYPYKCKDGKYIFTAWVGVTALKRGLPLLGFKVGSEDFPNPQVIIRGTPGSKKFEETFSAWCAERTAEDAEKELVAAGVPVSQIMNYEAAVNHPHYQAREVFTEWDDPEKGPVKGVGFIPKFTRRPGQVWRGAPAFNTDTQDILDELGYSEDEVRELVEKRAIANPVKLAEPVQS